MEKEKAEIASLVKKYGRVQSLMRFINKETLTESYRRQPKGKAVGVDEVTKEEYGENLEENRVNKHIMADKVNYILDADIKGFFGNIDHEWMIKFLEHDIADKNFIRYIRRFLIGGAMEDGKRLETEQGAVQGGLISPVLANVYLHYTLDTWFDYVKKREFHGEMYMVRYADDCAPRRRVQVA